MKKLLLLSVCLCLLLAAQTALALDTEKYTLHGDVRTNMSFDEVAAIERTLLQNYQEYPDGTMDFYAPGWSCPVKISGVTTVAGYSNTQVAFCFGSWGKGGLKQMMFVFESAEGYEEIERGLTTKYGATRYVKGSGFAPETFHLIKKVTFMKEEDTTRYSYRVIPWQGYSKLEIQHVEFPGKAKEPVHVLLYRLADYQDIKDYQAEIDLGDL